jgi:hypothetical protein
MTAGGMDMVLQQCVRPTLQYWLRSYPGAGHKGLVVASVEAAKGVRRVAGAPPQLHLPPHVAVDVLAVPGAHTYAHRLVSVWLTIQ